MRAAISTVIFKRWERSMTLKRYVLLFAGVAVLFIPPSLFANKLYFPQVAFGGGYTTTIILMNMGTTNVSSTFQVFGQTGTLLRSIPVTVPDGGSTRLSIADPGPSIISSWGVLDAGAATVQGAATFDVRTTNGALFDNAEVLGGQAANDFGFTVDVTRNGIANTGFALANVDPNSDVTVRLQLLSESGNGSPSVTGADSKTITLGSGHQIAVFVTSIWPQLAAAGFRGTLLIVVTSGPPNSLVLTALNLKEGLLSAAPAFSGIVNSCRGCFDF
jgi:hypothetical protein